MTDLFIVDYHNTFKTNGLNTYVNQIKNYFQKSVYVRLHFIWVNCTAPGFEKRLSNGISHYLLPGNTFALVLNIQTSLDGGVTLFKSGVAQTTGGSDGTGSDGSGGTGSDGSGGTGSDDCVKCDEGEEECHRVLIGNEVHIFYGERSSC